MPRNVTEHEFTDCKCRPARPARWTYNFTRDISKHWREKLHSVNFEKEEMGEETEQKMRKRMILELSKKTLETRRQPAGVPSGSCLGRGLCQSSPARGAQGQDLADALVCV